MRLTRRMFFALSGLALAGLAGCSSEPDREPSPQSEGASGEADASEPKPLTIDEQGWSADQNGYVNVGFSVTNPNQSLEADMVTVKITGRSSDGTIVFSDEVGNIRAIFPTETVYCGYSVGNGTAPDSVEVSIAEPTWNAAEPLPSEVFTVSNVAEVPNDTALMTSFTGELTANTDIDTTQIHQASIDVITRDESGSINYGANLWVDIPEKGVAAPFEISDFDVPPHASFEIYARIGW